MKQSINNSDTGLSVRTKINDNFTELYQDIVDLTVGTITLPAGSVPLSTLANQANNTILANNSGAAGPPVALNTSQTKALLAITSGDLSDFSTAVSNNSTVSANALKLAGVATGATANSTDATLLARANHTGTQLAATVSDFSAAADARVVAGITGKQPLATVLTNTTASYTTADQSKLAGIASTATVNSPDAILLARANHTGTQLAATISDFSTAVTAMGLATLSGVETLTNKTLDNTSTVMLKSTLFTVQDATDATKQARLQLSAFTTGNTLTYTLPGTSAGTYALLAASVGHTITATWTFSGVLTASAATVNLGSSVIASANSLGAGAITTGLTKAINLGTNGLSGSITNIIVGSSVAGSLGTMTINSPTVAFGASVTAINLPDAATFLVDNVDATKKVQFELSGITTATTRILTVPNASGTLAFDALFTTSANGLVPASGGGTTNFLRADGTFALPPAAGSGITSLTTDVVATGPAAAVATIQPGVVTLAKMATLAASSIIGNNTGVGATPVALTVAQTKALLAIANTDITGLGALATLATVSATEIASLAVTTAKIAANAATNAKLAQMATLTLKGNNTGVLADPLDLTAAQVKVLLAIAATDVTGLGALATASTVNFTTQATGIQQAAQEPAHTGDVTNAASSLAMTISANAVTNAKSAQMAAGTVKANVTAATADPVDVGLSNFLGSAWGYTETATAAATTTLTVTSRYIQVFTGATTQTIVVPAGATVSVGHSYRIMNKSTGILTVNSSGAGLICSIAAGEEYILNSNAAVGGGAGVWYSTRIVNNAFTSALTGLVPASGGGTANFLRADGAFAVPSGTFIATDNVQSGASYALVLADVSQELSLTNATGCTVSIPANATVVFPIGTRIPIWADAAGTYIITGATGVTFNGVSAGSGTMTVNVAGVRNGVILRKTAINTWTVSGAVGAVA